VVFPDSVNKEIQKAYAKGKGQVKFALRPYHQLKPSGDRVNASAMDTGASAKKSKEKGGKNPKQHVQNYRINFALRVQINEFTGKQRPVRFMREGQTVEAYEELHSTLAPRKSRSSRKSRASQRRRSVKVEDVDSDEDDKAFRAFDSIPESIVSAGRISVEDDDSKAVTDQLMAAAKQREEERKAAEMKEEAMKAAKLKEEEKKAAEMKEEAMKAAKLKEEAMKAAKLKEEATRKEEEARKQRDRWEAVKKRKSEAERKEKEKDEMMRKKLEESARSSKSAKSPKSSRSEKSVHDSASAREFFGKPEAQGVQQKELRSTFLRFIDDIQPDGACITSEQCEEINRLTDTLEFSAFEMKELLLLKTKLIRMERDLIAAKAPEKDQLIVTYKLRRVLIILRLMTSNVLVFSRANVPRHTDALFSFTPEGNGISAVDKKELFLMDGVFPSETSQDQVYKATSAQSIFTGCENSKTASVFFSGRSQTGKTFSMFGSQKKPGFVPRVISCILSDLRKRLSPTYVTKIEISLVEVLNELSNDLLQSGSDTAVPLRIGNVDGKPVCENLTLEEIQTEEEFNKIMGKAFHRRKTTALASSRMCHLILRLNATCRLKADPSHVEESKFFLVELAGMEKESIYAEHEVSEGINESLKKLYKLIAALSPPTEASNAVAPADRYKMSNDCLLTKVLADAFGPRAKLLLFSNVGNDQDKIEDYFRTLQWGVKAGRIAQAK